MTYKVHIAEIASEQIGEAYDWLMERTPLHAPLWHDGLLKAIESLTENPLRWPPVPEKEDPSGKARQFFHGDKRHAYRIIFEVSGDIVTVVQVLHAARER